MFKEVFAGRVIVAIYGSRNMRSVVGSKGKDESTLKYIALMQNDYGARYAELTFDDGIETVIYDVDAVLLSKE